MKHPSQVLHDAGRQPAVLPVCDHYAGSEKLMRKSLALQAQAGPVFDVTLDCEDGAAVGREAEHVQMAAGLAAGPENRHGRVGIRVHDVHHPAFVPDLEAALGIAGERLAFVMIPKVNSAADAASAADAVERIGAQAGLSRRVPVHVLIESHGGLREVFRIAAHPAIESLSFGLMDFVSAHHGAIPAHALTAAGQFEHPLVARAKLEISAACHAYGKVPSHNVVTELDDPAALAGAARRAYREFGYTRMWSIHPSQIDPIVAALSPAEADVRDAERILLAAAAADWGPIRDQDAAGGRLHDRASFRYYWNVLRRAHAAGVTLSPAAQAQFFS
ncbi:aldolase/citrate lyase family protein [Pigmentiphaga soli]|uniref:Aldolase/citrate lyase family protein n=1 Tax=Pigmentiphaga soli TaxID=1007095 RepID=A0ABP8HSS9_9BURK